jgi:hypothetical protein
MITSIPIELSRLNLGAEDYKKIARNVNRILKMSEEVWKRILNRANSELSLEVRTIAHPIVEHMANDREFYNEANLNYPNGPPKQGCFVTALADYLLRNQDKIKIT